MSKILPSAVVRVTSCLSYNAPCSFRVKCIQDTHREFSETHFILDSYLTVYSQVWLGGSALCDTIITCCMFYYLHQARKRSPVKRTTAVITHLIKLTVETGLVCATLAVVALILFVASRHTLLYCVFMGPVGKLSSNCLLAVSTPIDSIGMGRAT